MNIQKVQDGPNHHNSTSHQLEVHPTQLPQGRPPTMPLQEGPPLLPILRLKLVHPIHRRVGPLRALAAPIRPKGSLHLIQELLVVDIPRLKWLWLG